MVKAGAARSARRCDRQRGAAGVDTEEQAAALLSLGIDSFQGYLVGRPVEQPQTELEMLKDDIQVNGASIIEAYENVNLDKMVSEGHHVVAGQIRAVLSLVDFGILRRTWAYSKPDFAAVAATLLATLGLGVETGLVVGVAVMLINLLVDLSYVFFDPRIRY